MRQLITLAAWLLYAASFTPAIAETAKPTIVLVHGAFADASSWNGVASRLEHSGYTVRAIANPLRGVRTDGDYLERILKGISGPVVLVGHSYGGLVISEAGSHIRTVKALVFVAAFAPRVGESAADLTGKNPGSTLAAALADPVVLTDGTKDLYIRQSKFPQQFAADVPLGAAKVMAATQRPVADAALAEPAGNASWQSIPSWFVYGDADRNIPAATLQWMAERAHSRGTVAIKGASHVVMVSHPAEVTHLIEEAATAIQ
ncbi:alpha/beta fold hydrolase [Rhizobium sp. GR12]|uniref:alpha/beta fold hydrolase n=1 Tax=Rhizobium sp. GR12 TaxID=3053925 RepID=UPI002FBD8267